MNSAPRNLCYHQVLASTELGGANLIALRLVGDLRAQGCQAPLWVGGDGPAADRAATLGFQPRRFDSRGLTATGVLKPLTANIRFGWALRRAGRGLIHWHGLLSYGAARQGLALASQPSVVHIQIEEDEAALRWALRQPPDLVVTCARFLVEHVRQRLPEGLGQRLWIEAVPNAVDTQRFSPGDKHTAKTLVGAPLDTPLLLMLANLAPHKGQETALEVVAELKRRGRDVECWLAGVERGGGDSYTVRLRARIEELGIADRVRLLGFRQDTPELLRAADVFLLPSTQEGLPLTVLEAQASGVPVVAAPTAGVPEAIRDGETGFLIAADNARGYSDCVMNLLTSAELAQRIADLARAEVTRQYTWPTFVARVAELYRELLARKRA